MTIPQHRLVVKEPTDGQMARGEEAHTNLRAEQQQGEHSRAHLALQLPAPHPLQTGFQQQEGRSSISEENHVVPHLHPQSPHFHEKQSLCAPTGLSMWLPCNAAMGTVAAKALGTGSCY